MMIIKEFMSIFRNESVSLKMMNVRRQYSEKKKCMGLYCVSAIEMSMMAFDNVNFNTCNQNLSQF